MTSEIWWLDAYTDECSPAGPDLQSWAEWLGKPDNDWGRDGPAYAGQCFSASRMEMLPDVVATWNGEKFELSHEPEGADFFAVRFGEDMGWEPEAIGDCILTALINQEDGLREGDQVYVAIGRTDRTKYTVQFHYREPGEKSPALEIIKQPARVN